VSLLSIDTDPGHDPDPNTVTLPVAMMFLLALTVACRPPVTDDTATPVDSDPTESRPDSDLRVASFEVAGAFGYDPALDQAVGYYFGDTSTPPLMPWLELTFRLEADNQLPGPCRVTLQLEPAATDRADWVADPVQFGVDWDWDEVGYDDTCPDLDPALYSDTLLAMSQTWTFGIGVVPMTDDVFAAVEAAIVEVEGRVEWDSYWVDNVIGGAVSWSFQDSVWTGGWALGFEVDEDMALVSRTPSSEGPPPPHDPGLMVPLTREFIESSDGLPRGVYAVSSLIEFQAQDLIP
jgi:hypothetical protein